MIDVKNLSFSYENRQKNSNKPPSLIAYTPQNSGTYFDFSAFEVVLSGRARFMRGLKFSKTDHKIAQMALINVGAYELKNKAITALNGGER